MVASLPSGARARNLTPVKILIHRCYVDESKTRAMEIGYNRTRQVTFTILQLLGVSSLDCDPGAAKPIARLLDSDERISRRFSRSSVLVVSCAQAFGLVT
jgi:hypothetical protein